MAYIYPAPGVANAECVLTINSAVGLTGNLVVPALQDITLNAANDVFTWTQLDETAKLQLPTTSTNSLAMNLVLDQDSFFGTNPSAGGSVGNVGIFGLSTTKNLVNFTLYMGDQQDGSAGPSVSGNAYVTGLAPTVSADAPVWVSPITLTVTGEYTVSV